MLIEIHMIQNHAPANLNRDDLGAPKTCLFGGVLRARISSQCLKRSIRNPGNPEDAQNREPGLFAQAMAGRIGTRTKLFPVLVGEALKGSAIPEDEHERVTLAAQRIGTGKDEGAAGGDAPADGRPRTPQLINLGPGQAASFVAKLTEFRASNPEAYEYFLNPRLAFEEMVRARLAESSLSEKEQRKIVGIAWTVLDSRLEELVRAREGDDADVAACVLGAGPDEATAHLVADALAELCLSDSKAFGLVTRKQEKGEAAASKDDNKAAKKAVAQFMASLAAATRCDAVDIALFGRMTTSDAFEDVAAAMQVAHAISTHETGTLVDYFTAVDDLGRGPGAAHVGETMYNSACFYKYFCLDWDQLLYNLAGPEPEPGTDGTAHTKWVSEVKPEAERVAACTLGHFLRAAAMTTPSGKQNSFASHCDACGILVEVKRAKVPTNYANAFSDPVRRIGDPEDDDADEKSIEGRSVACLADHVHAVRQAYGIESDLLWYSPKLWRYPLHYWERADDGKKTSDVSLADQRFSTLGGGEGEGNGLVEAVVRAVGFEWADVRGAGRTSQEGA